MCVLFRFLEVKGADSSYSLNSYCPQSHLSMNDVSVDRAGRPEIIHLTLKASKTDPFRKGVTIFVGRTGKQLCPVVAVLAYLVWYIRALSNGCNRIHPGTKRIHTVPR